MSVRNYVREETTWGEWKKSNGLVIPTEFAKEAESRKATADTKIVAYKEVTPFGTFTLVISWLESVGR